MLQCAQRQGAEAPAPRLIDFHPPRADMRSDVLEGLSGHRKQLAAKYFYDERGSHLFDRITHLPEYYLTRTENRIMQDCLPDIANHVGTGAAVIEFGSGSGEKIGQLLQHLHRPVACVPVEISREHLLASARTLAREFPQLSVVAVCADFTRPFQLPPINGARRKLVFFPGSTIGNFSPPNAASLLRVMKSVGGTGGGLLIGVDLAKERSMLEAAYNDSQGVTAEFNLNLLQRINVELNADFDLGTFRHQAIYNEAERRIEMYLISRQRQRVSIDGHAIDFAVGEAILTEYSHKYSLASFNRLAAAAGYRVCRVWTDAQAYFSVQYLEPA